VKQAVTSRLQKIEKDFLRSDKNFEEMELDNVC
jgi:hypothetical protein